MGYLRGKTIVPNEIKEDGEVVVAKIIVPAGSGDQYFSFVTAESSFALKKCMDLEFP